MADPTVLDIITAAYRKIGVGQLGFAVPSDLAAEALALTQGAYEGLVFAGTFGALVDVITDEDYEAKENERIRYTGSAVITLPTTITDACTGDDRAPRDLSCVVVTKAATDPQISLYDALLGDWVRLDGLALATAAPLGRRGRDGLSCWIATKLAAANGIDALPSTLREGAKFMAALTGRYGSKRQPIQPDYF